MEFGFKENPLNVCVVLVRSWLYSEGWLNLGGMLDSGRKEHAPWSSIFLMPIPPTLERQHQRQKVLVFLQSKAFRHKQAGKGRVKEWRRGVRGDRRRENSTESQILRESRGRDLSLSACIHHPCLISCLSVFVPASVSVFGFSGCSLICFPPSLMLSLFSEITRIDGVDTTDTGWCLCNRQQGCLFAEK